MTKLKHSLIGTTSIMGLLKIDAVQGSKPFIAEAYYLYDKARNGVANPSAALRASCAMRDFQ